MQAKKDYENLPDDGELLYMISDNNDETKFLISQKYKPVITYYANKYSTYVEGKGLDFNDLSAVSIYSLSCIFLFPNILCMSAGIILNLSCRLLMAL